VLSSGAVPPASERSIGLEFYITGTPGASAVAKQTPEEFRVTEISSYPWPDPGGAYVVLRVVSRNWEQHELGGAIARELGLAPHAVAWSGTKDRRAVAERLLSYRGPLPEASFQLPGVEVLESYRARDGLSLGHHYANAFEIHVVPDRLPIADSLRAYDATAEELQRIGVVPNFFGPQRFGEVRPITHEVGRALVRGDPDQAVELYLTARPEGTPPGRGDAARASYAEHRDAARALREFPSDYRFERTLLERLARGQSATQALRGLSRELRLLFVHAYQSYVFNRWLSQRHRVGLPLTAPVVGDRLLRIGRDGTIRGQDAVPVESDNLSECSDLVGRGGALVAGPLAGYESPPPEGPVGEILHELLRKDGVELAGFRLPFAPEISSKGTWRPIVLPLPPVGRTGDSTGVWFRFALPKGSYATILLREFLKVGSTDAVGGISRASY
jgi:tRNA pseudouridine13 synthase